MYDTTRGSRSCTHYIFCFLRKDREERKKRELFSGRTLGASLRSGVFYSRGAHCPHLDTHPHSAG